MSLIAQVREDQLTARKNRNTLRAALLTTLLGEVGLVAKNAGRTDATDEEVIATIKKFIKNNETITGVARVPSHDLERDILNGYLPKQLTRGEMNMIFLEHGPDTKGAWMKILKDNYAGRYDGKVAAEIFDAMPK